MRTDLFARPPHSVDGEGKGAAAAGCPLTVRVQAVSSESGTPVRARQSSPQCAAAPGRHTAGEKPVFVKWSWQAGRLGPPLRVTRTIMSLRPSGNYAAACRAFSGKFLQVVQTNELSFTGPVAAAVKLQRSRTLPSSLVRKSRRTTDKCMSDCTIMILHSRVALLTKYLNGKAVPSWRGHNCLVNPNGKAWRNELSAGYSGHQKEF